MNPSKKPCQDCGRPFTALRTFSIRCEQCRYNRNAFITRLSQKVAKAIKAGRIHPIASQVCADCGAQAVMYDHRDYRRPLDVAPVCVRCNTKRGPAKDHLRH